MRYRGIADTDVCTVVGIGDTGNRVVAGGGDNKGIRTCCDGYRRLVSTVDGIDHAPRSRSRKCNVYRMSALGTNSSAVAYYGRRQRPYGHRQGSMVSDTSCGIDLAHRDVSADGAKGNGYRGSRGITYEGSPGRQCPCVY